MELAYWHWIIAGSILLICELFTFSTVCLIFGLGMFFTAAILWLFPGMELWAQIVFWGAGSSLMIIAWFGYFKCKFAETILTKSCVEGLMGLVILPAYDNKPGVIRFSSPFKGEDEWRYRSSIKFSAGDRARVIDVDGKILIIDKTN